MPEIFAQSGPSPPGPVGVLRVPGFFENIVTGIGNIANDFILRQTTNEEERFITGQSLPGDTPFGLPGVAGQTLDVALRSIGLGGGLTEVATMPLAQTIAGLVAPGLSIPQTITGQSIAPINCPTGVSSAFPAGSCLSINDWIAIGSPKGWQSAGMSPGGTVVMKKIKRRRRRRMFTAQDKADIQWAFSTAGNPKGPQALAAIMMRGKG